MNSFTGFMILAILTLPMATWANKSQYEYQKLKKANEALFVASLPVSTVTSDPSGDYEKLVKIIGSCNKAWQSKYSWDYIVRCPDSNDLVEISKKTPNVRFFSAPEKDEDFIKLVRATKILVNVNPFVRSSREGQVVTCYRVMAHGTDVKKLPDGEYAVDVCK